MNDEPMERLTRVIDSEADEIHWSVEYGRKHNYTPLIQAILSELSAAGVLNEWRPIETAPKDGTWFLGFWPDCTEEQNQFCSTAWMVDGDESRFIDDSDWRDWTQPTHWMPLPEPPQREGEPI